MTTFMYTCPPPNLLFDFLDRHATFPSPPLLQNMRGPVVVPLLLGVSCHPAGSFVLPSSKPRFYARAARLNRVWVAPLRCGVRARPSSDVGILEGVFFGTRDRHDSCTSRWVLAVLVVLGFAAAQQCESTRCRGVEQVTQCMNIMPLPCIPVIYIDAGEWYCGQWCHASNLGASQTYLQLRALSPKAEVVFERVDTDALQLDPPEMHRLRLAIASVNAVPTLCGRRRLVAKRSALNGVVQAGSFLRRVFHRPVFVHAYASAAVSAALFPDISRVSDQQQQQRRR